METAGRLEGVARNPSVHAAGVLIAPEPLKNLVPLYKTSKDEIVTQYDMKSLDQMGLLKMDFLGLTTLTVIDEAFDWIEKKTGKRLATEEIPLDDRATYELLSKGLTSGVFQFESSGMRDICIRYKPERLEDLCALNALYRPGPIQGGMVTDFIERKHGRREVTYLLPQIEPLLEETYGVILYQEQVMQIANVVAGFSLGEADLLRRAMGKKKVEEMLKQRERFMAGAKERGFPEAKVRKLFELMEQFAGYGFNKSHSAAYGFVAYITAYLKTNYPVAFMAALLSAESGNSEKVVRYINECRDMGIEVLAPDVHQSYWNFTPAGDKEIRFGLGAIKNVGKGAVDAVIEAREAQGGRFKSLFDFCENVDGKRINKRMLESAIKGGALDSLGGHRAQLTAALDAAIEAGQRATRDRETGQGALFGAPAPAEEDNERRLPDVPEWPEKEKLAGEKEIIGFYVTGHPLHAYEGKIAELATGTSATVADFENQAGVALCGVLGGIQRKRNREGRPWAAAALEDLAGSVDLLVFANQFDELAPQLVEDRAVLVRGSIRVEEGAPPKVSVQEIVPLDNARVSMPAQIALTVRLDGEAAGEETAAKLRELFASKPGETDVLLRLVRKNDFVLLYDVAARVKPDREFRQRVEAICGKGALELPP